MTTCSSRGSSARRRRWSPSSAGRPLQSREPGATDWARPCALTVDDHHGVHGLFHSGVGTLTRETSFPIVGYAEGDALAFCVDFGRFGSVVSWAGHHVADESGERLITLWHLAQPVEDPHNELDVWRSLLAGANEFQRVVD